MGRTALKINSCCAQKLIHGNGRVCSLKNTVEKAGVTNKFAVRLSCTGSFFEFCAVKSIRIILVMGCQITFAGIRDAFWTRLVIKEPEQYLRSRSKYSFLLGSNKSAKNFRHTEPMPSSILFSAAIISSI